MNKKLVRIIALVLASLMITSALIGGLSLLVHGAELPTITEVIVCKADSQYKNLTELTTTMTNGNAYSLNIRYTQKNTNFSSDTVNKVCNNLNTDKVSIPSSCLLYTKSSVSPVSSAVLTVEKVENDVATISLFIKNVTYNKGGTDLNISIKNVEDYSFDLVNIEIPSQYISGGSSGSNGTTNDDTITYNSRIVVENAVALDSAGNKIDKVTKDTPSFTLEVVYADMGLQTVDASDIKSADMQTYITNAGGFLLGSSTKGRVVAVSTTGDYPRFRATFPNVTFSGSGNSIEFQVYYILDDVDEAVSGSATATIYAARTDEDTSEEDKIGMASPNIIISNYTYGQDTIEAGAEFNLDFSIKNTSQEIPLENIVITLIPSKDLAVASSSNTIYVADLDKGASQSFSVALRAKSNAEVGSHSVDIKFSYEYIDEVKKERKIVADKMESIAIPVSQIDRFSVDPITESPFGQVGQETYITVTFINKGKSTTYNISGTVKCDESITAPSQHFGNLEAGKSDSMDFYFTGSQPGQFNGEIIISYEDENNNVKEIVNPVVIMVEEPWVPPVEPQEPVAPEALEPKGPGMLTIILCAIGGLAIAVPIALYLIKRIKAKGSEDFDEDF